MAIDLGNCRDQLARVAVVEVDVTRDVTWTKRIGVILDPKPFGRVS